MRILRHKYLSQHVDTDNVFKNYTYLSNLYFGGDNYFVFMKSKTSDNLIIAIETQPGLLEYAELKFNLWGISINEQYLVKYFRFPKIELTMICFSINTSTYLTIFFLDTGAFAVYIDDKNNTKTKRFIQSNCPYVVTKSGDNYTIHSFNDRNNGSNSSLLESQNLSFNNYEGSSPSSLETKFSTHNYLTSEYNSLINDRDANTLMYNYCMYEANFYLYFYNRLDFDNMLFNQMKELDLIKSYEDTTLTNYIKYKLNTDIMLVSASNTSFIYYNPVTRVYTFKDLNKYFMDETFIDATIFMGDTKFDLYKELLIVMNNIQPNHIRIGKILMEDDIQFDIDSASIIIESAYSDEQSRFMKRTDSVYDIIQPTNLDPTSSLINKSYTNTT